MPAVYKASLFTSPVSGRLVINSNAVSMDVDVLSEWTLANMVGVVYTDDAFDDTMLSACLTLAHLEGIDLDGKNEIVAIPESYDKVIEDFIQHGGVMIADFGVGFHDRDFPQLLPRSNFTRIIDGVVQPMVYADFQSEAVIDVLATCSLRAQLERFPRAFAWLFATCGNEALSQLDRFVLGQSSATARLIEHGTCHMLSQEEQDLVSFFLLSSEGREKRAMARSIQGACTPLSAQDMTRPSVVLSDKLAFVVSCWTSLLPHDDSAPLYAGGTQHMSLSDEEIERGFEEMDRVAYELGVDIAMRTVFKEGVPAEFVVASQ